MNTIIQNLVQIFLDAEKVPFESFLILTFPENRELVCEAANIMYQGGDQYLYDLVLDGETYKEFEKPLTINSIQEQFPIYPEHISVVIGGTALIEQDL